MCSRCKQVKNIQKDFAKKKEKPQSLCRDCTKISSDIHYQANKEKIIRRSKERTLRVQEECHIWIWAYLLDHPCVECKEEDPLVLQFDHRDSSLKVLEVSEMIRRGYGLSKVKEEVYKCDIRCANCHARKTALNGGFWKTRFQ